MGQPLDSILKKDLYGSRDNNGNINYETINTNGNSIKADLSGSEQGYFVAITYTNGASLDVDFNLEVSEDGISFVPIDTAINVTDASGEIIWDVIDSNANFIRVSWAFNSGSVDIYARTSAKRRH